jgi:acyl dehydratase
MPFNAAMIGEQLEPLVWEVTPRRVLAFKAALAPEAVAALDDTTSNGRAALPMMIVSPEWQVVLSSLTNPRYGLSAQERIQGVHASQDTRFHRRVEAGDRLQVRGRIAGAHESRAGVVVRIDLETEDMQSQAIAAQSIYTIIYRGVRLSGQGSPSLPPESYEFSKSDDIFRREIDLSAGFCHVYSECAAIWNPIHTEKAVAARAGLTGPIVHGTALWALAGLSATGGADAQRVWLLRRLVARFHRPAYPGEPVRIEFGGGQDGQLFRICNGRGEMLASGRAESGATPLTTG